MPRLRTSTLPRLGYVLGVLGFVWAVAGETAAERRASPSVPPEGMVLVPGGRVLLGHVDAEERRPFTVNMASFYLDATEVTVAAYAACVQSGRCGSYTASYTQPRATTTEAERGWLAAQCTYGVPGREQHPMSCVTYEEARAYCATRGARLPTQDEWEHAVRGGTRRGYPWGDEAPRTVVRANYGDLALKRALAAAGLETSRGFVPVDDGFGATAPVRAFPTDVTPLQVFDLGGNVREWTSSPSLYDLRYPRGTLLATCGGDWRTVFSDAAVCLGNLRDDRTPDVGFRCAQDVPRALPRARRRGVR